MPASQQTPDDKDRRELGGDRAKTRLQEFRWPTPTFTSELSEELASRRILDLPFELRDQDFPSLEPEDLVRLQTALGEYCHHEQFATLSELSHDFVADLIRTGRMVAFTERAGMRCLPSSSDPKDFIYFGPPWPPRRLCATISELAREVGGRNILGHRLVWWCAAAHDPKAFGLMGDFQQQIRCLPAWATIMPNIPFFPADYWRCRLDDAPLELIREAVTRTAGVKEPKADGPDRSDMTFWNGGACRDLQRKPFEIAEALWMAPGKSMKRDQLIAQVWKGELREDVTYRRTTERANAVLNELGLHVDYVRGPQLYRMISWPAER